MIKLKHLLLVFSILIFHGRIHSQNEKIIAIDASRPYAEIQPTMWGIFFEDINFAADGGLYAEMVKNRSFEFYKPLMGWKTLKYQGGNGNILIINQGDEKPNNQRFARITSTSDAGGFGITNEGFRGMGIKKDLSYDFSIHAKIFEGNNLTLKLELVNAAGEVIGESSITGFTSEWKTYNTSIHSLSTELKAKLNVIVLGNGSLDVDMISLFPQDTWKGRPKGLRSDLVQMLDGLKPCFIRFPGGCIVEGHELETRYQWKKTIGDIDERKTMITRWNTEMRNRQAPDYFQSFGLGFYEYFLLCEDLGAEPMPIINCGMACQFNTSEVVPLNQLEPYIQDALDLIEFANGPADSKWGKVRADLGHPAPFHMKLLGIGNEQWDKQYIERYIPFANAIKEKYPDIKLISSAGPSPSGERFDYLWGELQKLNADLVDEHYYQSPEWFLKNAGRYDKYDRKGPKVFAGEYAAHGKEDKPSESRNHWESALAEAAFMTGLERNADVVYMASYAPLFAHVEAWQWRPDLIWFDNLNVVGTPNYYVQQLFSLNKGTHAVPALSNGLALSGADSLYASAVIDKKSKELIIKIVNADSVNAPVKFDLKGVALATNIVKISTLAHKDLSAYNSIENPRNIFPKESTIKASGNKITLVLEPRSVNVLKVSCKKL